MISEKSPQKRCKGGQADANNNLESSLNDSNSQEEPFEDSVEQSDKGTDTELDEIYNYLEYSQEDPLEYCSPVDKKEERSPRCVTANNSAPDEKISKAKAAKTATSSSRLKHCRKKPQKGRKLSREDIQSVPVLVKPKILPIDYEMVSKLADQLVREEKEKISAERDDADAALNDSGDTSREIDVVGVSKDNLEKDELDFSKIEDDKEGDEDCKKIEGDKEGDKHCKKIVDGKEGDKHCKKIEDYKKGDEDCKKIEGDKEGDKHCKKIDGDQTGDDACSMIDTDLEVDVVTEDNVSEKAEEKFKKIEFGGSKQKKAKSKPVEKMAKVSPNTKKSKHSPKEQKAKVEPSEKKAKTIPKEKKTKVEPAEKKAKTIPKEKKAKVEPAEKKARTIPKEKKAKVEPTEKKAKAIPKEKKTNTGSNDLEKAIAKEIIAKPDKVESIDTQKKRGLATQKKAIAEHSQVNSLIAGVGKKEGLPKGSQDTKSCQEDSMESSVVQSEHDGKGTDSDIVQTSLVPADTKSDFIKAEVLEDSLKQNRNISKASCKVGANSIKAVKQNNTPIKPKKAKFAVPRSKMEGKSKKQGVKAKDGDTNIAVDKKVVVPSLVPITKDEEVKEACGLKESVSVDQAEDGEKLAEICDAPKVARKLKEVKKKVLNKRLLVGERKDCNVGVESKCIDDASKMVTPKKVRSVEENGVEMQEEKAVESQGVQEKKVESVEELSAASVGAKKEKSVEEKRVETQGVQAKNVKSVEKLVGTSVKEKKAKSVEEKGVKTQEENGVETQGVQTREVKSVEEQGGTSVKTKRTKSVVASKDKSIKGKKTQSVEAPEEKIVKAKKAESVEPAEGKSTDANKIEHFEIQVENDLESQDTQRYSTQEEENVGSQEAACVVLQDEKSVVNDETDSVEIPEEKNVETQDAKIAKSQTSKSKKTPATKSAKTRKAKIETPISENAETANSAPHLKVIKEKLVHQKRSKLLKLKNQYEDRKIASPVRVTTPLKCKESSSFLIALESPKTAHKKKLFMSKKPTDKQSMKSLDSENYSSSEMAAERNSPSLDVEGEPDEELEERMSQSSPSRNLEFKTPFGLDDEEDELAFIPSPVLNAKSDSQNGKQI